MEWRVRYVDYPAQFRKMENEIMGTIHQVLSQGDLMLRQQLRDFEANLASFVGTQHAIGVSNCTDGLRLSLLAAGIGPGDEVITVSHTFVATAAAIHHVGAKPVLVDIGDDHNMNVHLVEKEITARTKAIMPVHLNGRTCDMGRLMPLAERYGLTVIEDAAQAVGASYDGKRAGSFGLAGCFSFYPAKLLGAFGDAGAVVTNDEELAKKVRLLRDHGRASDGHIACWSFNCRMDNLQAAILDLKLKLVPEWIRRRRGLARIYHETLSSIARVLLPPPPCEVGPYFDVFQNYEIEAEDRDRLVAHLKANSVEVMLPWGGRGVHQFPSLGLTQYSLPRTDQMFRGALMLPMHTELTDDQVEYVATTVKEFYAS
jgi:dTDP-4-amino-4,6-dideoxygalactose transaminase